MAGSTGKSFPSLRSRISVGLVVFAVAFVLRGLFLAEMADDPLFTGREVEPDAAYYDKAARDIASGEIIASEAFYMAPLYPYTLGLVYAVGGDPDELSGDGRSMARWVQAAGGAAAAALIASIAWCLGGWLAGLIAGLVAAGYGFFVFQDSLLMATTVILLAHLAALRAFLGAARRPESRWRWLLAGVLTGVSVLSHGTALLVLAAMLAWSCFSVPGAGWRERGVRVALILAGVVPCLGLTTLHNALASGHFVPLTTNAGRNFFIGNNPTATGSFKFYDFGMKGSALAFYLMDRERSAGDPPPSAASRRALQRAVAFAIQNPVKQGKLLAHKAGLMLNRLELSTRYNYYYAKGRSRTLTFAGLGFGVVAPLGLVGLVLLARRSPGHLAVVLLAACQLISFTLTFVLGRYRVVFVACLIVGAALLVLWLLEAARAKRWLPVAAAVAGVGLAALVVHRPLDGFDEKRGWGTLNLHAGTVYLERDQLDRAERALRRASEGSFEPLEMQHVWRSKAHTRIGDLHVRRGDLRGALEAYRDALAEARREVPGRQRANVTGFLRERVQRLEAAVRRSEEAAPEASGQNPRTVPGA